jgi:hypothetical protein
MSSLSRMKSSRVCAVAPGFSVFTATKAVAPPDTHNFVLSKNETGVFFAKFDYSQNEIKKQSEV